MEESTSYEHLIDMISLYTTEKKFFGKIYIAKFFCNIIADCLVFPKIFGFDSRTIFEVIIVYCCFYPIFNLD